MKKNKKVCIAMSGGVDSSVAAGLLKKQGYDCVGVFMHFWADPLAEDKALNKCCSTESFQLARRVAGRLGFPLYTLNLKDSFKKQVVDNFLDQYQKGFTPNPCIRCNQFIKFDLLVKKAKMLGCNYLATGHYVKKSKIRNKKIKIGYELLQAKDKKKDQSYFLYNLKQNQLGYLLFPLGNYTKPQVRAIAARWHLPSASRPDSQEICFIGGKNHNDFLKRYLNLKPGAIKTVSGKTIGRHEGLPLYTLGQRKGIKIGGIGPFYVVGFDYKNNVLIVSNSGNDAKLYAKQFTVKKINWINQPVKNCQVKIRYQAPAIKCQITKNKIILAKPQRAVTPGQSAVFYDGQKMLGGGIIDKIH